MSDVCGMEGEVITMNDVVSFEYEGENAAGTVVGRYRTAAARPSFSARLNYFGLENAWMDAIRTL
jgi:pilus assembly protein CpaF